MATSAASQAKGAITFSSSFFAQITSLNWSGISREAFDTSHMGLSLAGSGKFGNMTKIPSKLNDPGKLEVEFNFNPDTLPPIEGAAETVTVTIGDSSTPATWAGSGFMTEFSWEGPLQGIMKGKATITFSGNVTRTAGT